MKPKAVLISPLGLSPGAVSGVYFALRKQGVPVGRVVAVTTDGPEVRRVANAYVARALPPEVDWRPVFLPGQDFYGGKKTTIVYQRIFALQVRMAHNEGHAVHVAVTGGRSGMGATAAMVAQFFGATALWHLWVAPDIEDQGHLYALDRRRSALDPRDDPLLNPTLRGEDAYALVQVPFVDLRSWRTEEQQWETCLGDWPPERRREMMAMVRRMSMVLEEDAWDRIQTWARKWETLSYRDQIQVAEALENILVANGLLGPNSRFAQILQDAHTVEALEASLGAYDWAGFLQQAWRWMKEHPQASASIAGTFLRGLEFVVNFFQSPRP